MTNIRTIFINSPDTIQVIDTLCANDSLLVGGQVFNELNPSDTFFVPNALCGQWFEVDLDFTGAVQVVDTLRQTLCPGDTLVLGDQVFDGNNPEGLVNFMVSNSQGCDSTLYVIVDFFPAAQGVFTTTACRGDTVFVEGAFFTADDPNGVV
ncbi:MAG: hypothetical protein AAGA62_14900, partial [Bacteroidota bacterium]